jgi:RHS repeat-associated protein
VIAGQVKELYAYGGVGGAGQRLSKVKTKDDGSKEDSYYTHHPLGDVEAVTDTDGNTRDTYGYTAYGKDDNQQFTGADKPDPANPDKAQDNVYRFNAKRWDAAAGTYDMGFRDYDPGLNRYLTRDSPSPRPSRSPATAPARPRRSATATRPSTPPAPWPAKATTSPTPAAPSPAPATT